MGPLQERLPDHIKNYLAYSHRGTHSLKDENGNPIRINGKEVKISKFDFKSLSKYPDDKILDIIRRDTGIDLKSNPEEGLRVVNRIMFFTGQVYHSSITKKIFERKGVKNPNFDGFTSIKGFIEFIREAGNLEGGWESKLKCLVVKSMSSVHDILNTPGVNNLDEKKGEIIDKLGPILSLKEVGDDLQGMIGGIKFLLFGRGKKVESIIHKNLNDPDYSKVEEIKDNIGLTFEMIGGSQEDYLKLFLIIQNVIVSIGGELSKGKIKGIDFDKINFEKFSQEDISILNGLSYDKKDGTSEDYKDIKFSCEIGGVKVEIKITPHQNKNQEGLNFQGIYAYLSKYIEGITMRHINDGYATENDLNMYACLFFENLQTMLNENPETAGMSKEEYLPTLWNDLQERGFIRKKIKMKNRDLVSNINTYLKPGLTKYFKSKLVEDIDENGNPIWRNEKSKIIYNHDFEKEAT